MRQRGLPRLVFCGLLWWLSDIFSHSSARGKQWECPGLGAGPSLPSPASSIATVASNTAATATSRSVHTSSLSRGTSPAGGLPLPVRVASPSDSTRSAFQGVGHGHLPLPPLPLGVQIPTAAAGAHGEAVPRAHGTQQLLPPWGGPSACGGSTGHGKETTGHLGSVELGLAQNGDGDRSWAGKQGITSRIQLDLSWVSLHLPMLAPHRQPLALILGLDEALLAVEMENRRLEDELLALKVRRERRADAGR